MPLNRHNHIIQRQAIEVKLASGENVAAVHDRIRNIYMEKIIPTLDTLFSGLTNDEMILRINSLHLDLGVIEIDKLEEQFAEKTRHALRESLEKKLQFDIAEQDMELVQRHSSFADAFFYFLESGQLPWWCEIKDLAILEKEITSQPGDHASLKNKLAVIFANKPASVKRLSFQFSDSFLQFITQLYLPSFKPVELLKEMKSFLLVTTGADPVYLPDLFWQIVYKHLIPSSHRIHAAVIKGLVHIACEKYNLSRAGFLHSVIRCDANVFPYLHSFFSSQDEMAVVTPDNKNLNNNNQCTTKGEKSESKEIKDDGNDETTKDSSKAVTEGLPGKESKDMAQSTGINDKITGKSGAGQQEDKADKNENRDFQELRNKAGENDRRTNAGIQKEDVKKQPGSTMVYPELVGLVILHPFLSSFFAGLALIDGKKFLDDEALYKAIGLLGYMATGEMEVQEQRLVIPKLLCGMDLSAPVKRDVLITAEERHEADKLLNAVITHWTALKNTSRDGLRDTFLKREGKLCRTDNGWQLEVERKTWDILLSRLPWGFSMIKFPWMKELVFVNWG